MTLHVQAISKKFSESSDLVWYDLDQKTLDTLVSLLSQTLEISMTSNDSTPKMFSSDGTEWASEPDSHKEHIRNNVRSISTRQAAQLVADTLETASDLLLVR